MKERTYDHLLDCTRQVEDMEMAVDKFLCKLKESNYKTARKFVPTCVRKLNNCNVLFAKGDEIFPQNRLTEYAIERSLLT